ncbi:hypothetical protein MNBD_BACTEROID04-1523 [hydrothermal vent metagenome]|uniref:DUF2490 domain-containing protein n=1 Tax=hydrothermal vent metagenome TaxID=652676 RepID=A0A3B0UJG7_9ZZZZ
MNIIANSIKRISLILLILPFTLLAQQEEVGNWLMYFGTNKISDKYSIHTEIQYRNYTITPNNTEQLLLRTGLNYHFSKRATVTAGYAYIPSYVYESEQKSPETEEHRIWQQFILTNKIGNVKFEHRYRIEQRWVNQDYRNRLRYRLMLFVPLNKPVIEEGSLFLGLYDEIFINTKETFFDRNRLYGALGYQYNKATSLQVGMMHQQVNNTGKWYLQFALVFNTDLRNKNN